MEDKKILELYFKRDEQAISESRLKYGAFCHRIALNILSVPEDAEECVSDTWLTAWNRIPPVVPDSFKAFLGKITRDLSISRYRANHAKKRYSGMEVLLSELEDCIPSPFCVEVKVEEEQLSRQINRWLDALPKEDRVLFVKRYWYGETVKNLAKLSGYSESQMAQRMLRLRKSLKVALERWESQNE